jgi:hypothetical protein
MQRRDHMKRTATAIIIATLSLTAGCGNDDTPAAQDNSSAEATPTQSTEPTPSTSEPAGSSSLSATTAPEPTYAVLSKDDLESALLTIQDLPAGYSQDPPSEPSTKTFCDYKPPFTEKMYVSHDFTKGGGMSSELLTLGLRQFESAEQARAAFEALSETLETCPGETYNGSKVTYALMSAPKVGDDAVGVRIESDQFTLLQNFVLAGPTLVVTGGGGLIEADADEVASLLQAQVAAYQNAAME